jgi:hypothetical protein
MPAAALTCSRRRGLVADRAHGNAVVGARAVWIRQTVAAAAHECACWASSMGLVGPIDGLGGFFCFLLINLGVHMTTSVVHD